MKPITLRQARERIKPRMTQERLAELADVDQTTISSLETGRHTNPTKETIERLAEALGITPSDLRFPEPEPGETVARASDRPGQAVRPTRERHV